MFRAPRVSIGPAAAHDTQALRFKRGLKRSAKARNGRPSQYMGTKTDTQEDTGAACPSPLPQSIPPPSTTHRCEPTPPSPFSLPSLLRPVALDLLVLDAMPTCLISFRSRDPVRRVTCHGSPASPRLVLAERQPVGPNETGATNTLLRSHAHTLLCIYCVYTHTYTHTYTHAHADITRMHTHMP